MSSPFKSDILSKRVALVTGGATGICFGIAEVLGAHGATIALMGRRQAVLDEACQKLNAAGIVAAAFQGDVRDAKSAQNVVNAVRQRFGRLDILVNGAAGNFLCSADDLSPNAFQTVIAIDLLGTFNMCNATFKSLVESKGCIINISATLHYGATIYQAHASAAKAGVDSLTRSLAIEWGQHGIRINGIAPGPIAETEGMKRLGAGRTEKDAANGIPLKRFGRVHEIGYAALFLACDTIAGYISGDTIVVDGGSWLARQSTITPEIYQVISAARKQERAEKPTAKL